LVMAAILLTACAGIAEHSDSFDADAVQVDPDIVPVDRPAPTADLGDHDPPETLVDREIVDPSWSEPPKAAGDLFVGLRPVDDKALELTAVDASGTVLWTARRPLACTGFALADVGDRITVVLTDLEPGRDTAITTTATAYDLATGEQL